MVNPSIRVSNIGWICWINYGWRKQWIEIPMKPMVLNFPLYLFLKIGLVLEVRSSLSTRCLAVADCLFLLNTWWRCSFHHQLKSGHGQLTRPLGGMVEKNLCIYLCIGIYLRILVHRLHISSYTLNIGMYYLYLHTLFTHMNDIKSPLNICIL